ncbi:MAG: hypothetical protein P8Y58_16460 [Novosphingobium sp.]
MAEAEGIERFLGLGADPHKFLDQNLADPAGRAGGNQREPLDDETGIDASGKEGRSARLCRLRRAAIS